MGIFDTTIDITHHPKRTQRQNLIDAGIITADDTVTSSSTNPVGDAPINVTLESAIEYFKNNATGQRTALYLFTADVLEKYRQIDNKTKKEMANTVNVNEV